MSGSSRDLDELARSHGAEVYGLLAAITHDPATAEDLTQEVFLVALRKNIGPGRPMRQWLRNVGRKLALNELRRKRPALLGPHDIERACADAAPAVGDPSGSGFEEELAALRECLRRLPVADRKVLASRYESSDPLSAIAEKARTTVGYLKQRLFRLRRRLAECIRRRLGGSEAAGV